MKNKNNIGLLLARTFATGLAILNVTSVYGAGIENPIDAQSLEQLIGNIIRYALGLTAVVAVGFIVYGGFLYITAAGDETQIKAGKQAIIGAVIGIVVIGLAYAIVEFVVKAMGGGGSNIDTTKF